MAVGCSRFDKLKAAILDIKQQHITPQNSQKDEINYATVNSKLC